MMIKTAAIFSFFMILLPLQIFAVEERSMHIPEHIIVHGDAVQLGDIASFHGLDVSREKKLQSISLGSFSLAEAVKEFSGDAIKVRMDLAGVHLNGIALHIPDKVVVVRTLEQLRVLQSVKKEQMHEEEALAEERSEDPGITVTDSKKAEDNTDSAELGFTQGVAMKSNLRPGDIITAQDLMYITFRRPRTDVIPSMDVVVGRRALVPLRRRSLLKIDMFGAFDVVEGEQVRVQVKRAGFVVETLASASANGVTGDVISVINPRTRKYFSARVAGPGLVEALF